MTNEIPDEIRAAIDALLKPYGTNIAALTTASRMLEMGERPVRFLSIREVCNRLSLSKPTVWRLMRDGVLKGKKIGAGKLGGRCLIYEDSLASYIASLPDWRPLEERK